MVRHFRSWRMLFWSGAPVLVLLAMGYWGRAAAPHERAIPYALDIAEVALLQEGDIILRRGSGLVSDMIAKLLNEEHDISHCGIVVEQQGEFWVIHAVANSVSGTDGMQVHRLQDFVQQSRPNSVIISRLHAAPDGSRIADKAVHYLQRKIPFDHHFDLSDTSQFYCSELIWRIVLDEHGLDVFKDALDAEKGYYRFSNFLDPEWFDVVLNHQER